MAFDWKQPDLTAETIAGILKPPGKFIAGFEDREQLKKRSLDDDIFRVYSLTEVKNLLSNAGFINGIDVTSRKCSSSVVHCVVAVK